MSLRLPDFQHRVVWFVENRPELCANVAALDVKGASPAPAPIVAHDRLEKMLARCSTNRVPESLRHARALALSQRTSVRCLDGQKYGVDYEPAESTSGLFGGNSNWRGPVWFPINFLMIEALQKFHYYYGDDLKVECPAGSGKMLTFGRSARTSRIA